MLMTKRVAIIGAGVSGLTCGVVFAERGYHTTILAEETGTHTTSAAAAAIWYPYDVEPATKVIAWALESYDVFRELSRDPRSGVSMIELRTFSRAGEIAIPLWATKLGARATSISEFVMTVPLTDTTIYLDYLQRRLTNAGGEINAGTRFAKLEDVDPAFDFVINCAGFGAKELVHDVDLEPHRGQVAVVQKFGLTSAVVSNDAPLMYAIPRTNDCVFGGTNELSNNRAPEPSATSRIVAECSRVLNIDEPKIIAERVGLRPFRKSGIRVEPNRLHDGRCVIHNYGHGGAGFTVSWGCASSVLALASNAAPNGAAFFSYPLR
jgi:D-amino-acid oxidase